MANFDKNDFLYFNVKSDSEDLGDFIVLRGLLDEGEATLKENNWHLEIPDRIDNLPVVVISALSFPDYGIEELTLGKNVRCIGEKAFKGNSIHKVEIPDSVEDIDLGAFADCPVEEVISPNGRFSLNNIGLTNLENGTNKLKDEDTDESSTGLVW